MEGPGGSPGFPNSELEYFVSGTRSSKSPLERKNPKKASQKGALGVGSRLQAGCVQDCPPHESKLTHYPRRRLRVEADCPFARVNLYRAAPDVPRVCPGRTRLGVFVSTG
jgi:hypothetical protein